MSMPAQHTQGPLCRCSQRCRDHALPRPVDLWRRQGRALRLLPGARRRNRRHVSSMTFAVLALRLELWQLTSHPRPNTHTHRYPPHTHHYRTQQRRRHDRVPRPHRHRLARRAPRHLRSHRPHNLQRQRRQQPCFPRALRAADLQRGGAPRGRVLDCEAAGAFDRWVDAAVTLLVAHFAPLAFARCQQQLVLMLGRGWGCLLLHIFSSYRAPRQQQAPPIHSDFTHPPPPHTPQPT